MTACALRWTRRVCSRALFIAAMRCKELDLKAGDEVRMEPNFKVALEHFAATKPKIIFWKKCRNCRGRKSAVRKKRSNSSATPSNCRCFIPNCSSASAKNRSKAFCSTARRAAAKRLIGKATAYNLTSAYNERTGQELKEYFMLINGPQILNMWLGETERQIREIFQIAREKAKAGHLVFIFIDEAESIVAHALQRARRRTFKTPSCRSSAPKWMAWSRWKTWS